MSLTRILRKRRHPATEFLKSAFPRPEFARSSDILIQSDGEKSNEAADIGTAFDYLFRAAMLWLHPSKCESGELLAQRVHRHLLERFKGQKSPLVELGHSDIRRVDRVSLIDYMETAMESYQRESEHLLATGEMTHELIRTTLYLAHLDNYSRSGRLGQIDTIREESVDTLYDMTALVSFKQFEPKKRAYLNPSFGEGSRLVGAADADLITDDFLIDLKTTKHMKLDRLDLDQLAGYFLLSHIGRMSDPELPKVRRLGLYYARYGKLWEWQEPSQLSEEHLDELAKEFQSLIGP